MALSVADLVRRAGFLLLDEEHVRWTAEELIDWINEAAGAILTYRPQAFSRTAVHALAAGTLQMIPEDGAQLLDVVRNIAADGTTPGAAIRRTDRQQLDDIDLDWHAAKQKAKIKHYTVDDRQPKQFYTYPPAIAGTNVELAYAALPPTVTSEDDAFAIGAEYAAAVVNYLCYRAHCKDSEFANGQIAAAFYQAFEAGLGVKSQTSIDASPNQPGNSV
jgi:hypothetical protein